MDRRRLSACANFMGYTDAMGYINQPNTEQRRLSEGPSLRLPNYNLNYPGEYGGSESCMLKQKNSSLTMLLDSTNSFMRTASTTIHSLFGAPRRASFCGEPDPTIQCLPMEIVVHFIYFRILMNRHYQICHMKNKEEQSRFMMVESQRHQQHRQFHLSL